MFQIAVIGAGQLGSRHLQGLAKGSFSAEIWVMDPSADSLKVAEERYNEVKSDTKKVFFVSSVGNIQAKKLDLVIVATNSFHRLESIKNLVNHCAVSYLVLEKVLFPSVEEYAAAQQLIADHKIKTWVNCPLRMNEFFAEVKANIKGKFSYAITGNSWGLGCNTIHHLDLFSYLSGSTDVQLNSFISSAFPAKRNGYIEFEGSVKGRDEKGNLFSSSSVEAGAIEVLITIHGEGRAYMIDMISGAAWLKSAEANNQWEQKKIRIAYQSELSKDLSESIFNTGTCGLTPFEESAKLHIAFINTLIQYLQQNSSEKITKCPIT
ncbi:MAG: Gfo/Idh/MocA family oxidoreductase [Flavobacteriales bacterium]